MELKRMKTAQSWLLLAGILLLAGACNKEETTETKPSLSGLAVTKAIPYIALNTEQEFTIDDSNVVSSDGSTLGQLLLSWKANTNKIDTLDAGVKSFKFTADEVRFYYIYCYASAGSGYYTATTNTTFRVVDPETSLVGLAGERSTVLDGNRYRTVSLGGLTWMAENLYSQGSGRSYMNSPVMDSVFGRYYTWEEAQSACPSGWRLPSAAEWDNIGTDACALMADAHFLDQEMWEYWPHMTLTNEKKFNAIPVGYQDLTYPDAPEKGANEFAAFWTATESSDSQLAHYRYIYEDQLTVGKAQGDKKTLALSVRCVK